MDGLRQPLVGTHGTVYESDSELGLNVKVTKPDGKTFWIPLSDFYLLVYTIEREVYLQLQEEETERVMKLSPDLFIRSSITNNL